MSRDTFTLAGIRPEPFSPVNPQKHFNNIPFVSIILLGVILCACIFSEFVITKDPAYLDLMHSNVSPDTDFLFGTDLMGRDIFSMIWSGGRVSLFIGFASTAISTIIAILLGSVSAFAPPWIDTVFMRGTDILLSIPTLLIVILLQAAMGETNVFSLAVVIGLTSWTSIAKIIRTEVRQIRNSEYVIAAKCMGAGFHYVLWKHLTPNFISSIMFMVVMNIRSAIIAESTLSFIGIGLPLDVISWGSMLSLSERALMTASWWIILIPGAFLVTTLICVTNIGNYLRKHVNRKHSNL